MSRCNVIGVYESKGDHWEFLGYLEKNSKLNDVKYTKNLDDARKFKTVSSTRSVYGKLIRIYPRYTPPGYSRQTMRFDCQSVEH